MKLRLLIFSFSPIERDARVLKQVRAFADEYEVTTCGYGGSPDPRVEHLQIPDDAIKIHSKLLLLLKRHKRQYWESVQVCEAQKLLKGRQFDLILADDLDTVPLALSLAPRYGVHADIHEYWPGLHDESLVWRLSIGAYNSWLCKTYLPQARSMSTVSRGLIAEYRRKFGLESELVMNAAPFQDREPTPTQSPMRIVHSGAALRNRSIHTMVEAMDGLEGQATLDLFLTPNDLSYLDELKTLVESRSNVTLNEPVPYAELADTLAGFDVGVHILPPIGFNNRNALPNKLFDFVQARLAVVVGPTPEMAEFVRRYKCGAVAPGFEAQDLTAVLKRLDPSEADSLKAASHVAAREVAADVEVDKWRAALIALTA